MSDVQKLQDDVYAVISEQLGNLKNKASLSDREISTLTNVYANLRKLEGDHTQEKWFERLQELVQASDSIQNLVLGDPEDFNRVFGASVIFDRKGKKKITLNA